MVTKAQYLDPVQFGRWVSERRRALGWPSQRALAEAAEHDPVTRESGITESFLARLEAGVLVWPPRGGVRLRAIELAWFLCESPRAVASYLHLAGCTRLTDDERALVARITGFIAASTASVPMLLPPQLPRLVGRDVEVSKLVEQIVTLGGGCCAITGMMGIGKSAVAVEALHRLAKDSRRRAYYFPDGIIGLSMKHRRGLHGLLEVLDEVCALCAQDAQNNETKHHSPWRPQLVSVEAAHEESEAEDGETGRCYRDERASPSELAAATNRTRMALAGKRLLLLLDDLDPRFPLSEALDALLPSGSLHGYRGEDGLERGITVLVTCRAAPDSPLARSLMQLGPIGETASLALFAERIGRELSASEGVAAANLCAGLARLPRAIELAASAVRTDGIPIELLARLVEQRPLDESWHGGEILREQFADAVASLRPDARTTLALLPILGSRTFTLRIAAVLKEGIDSLAPAPSSSGPQLTVVHELGPTDEKANRRASEVGEQIGKTPDQNISSCVPIEEGTASAALESQTDSRGATALASTAAALGQLVRTSLLDVIAAPTNNHSIDNHSIAQSSQRTAPIDGQPRYQISPLLHAYALEALNALDPEQRERAYRNVHAYALDIVEHYPSAPQRLVHEWPVVMTAFTRSLRAGHDQQTLDLVNAFSRQPLTMLRFQEHARFILDAGITAYRRADDRLALMCLLSRLGVCLYYQGSLDEARRVWTESAQIAESLPLSCGPYFPHYNLAVLSVYTGAYSAAQKFLDQVMVSAIASAHSSELAYTYSARAEVFHRQGEIDRALANLSTAQEGLVACAIHEAWDEACLDSMLQTIRLERARMLGQYAQARDLADAMSRPIEPSIASAQIALDQAEYAARRGLVDDARTFALRAATIGNDMRAGLFPKRAKSLLERLDERGADER